MRVPEQRPAWDTCMDNRVEGLIAGEFDICLVAHFGAPGEPRCSFGKCTQWHRQRRQFMNRRKLVAALILSGISTLAAAQPNEQAGGGNGQPPQQMGGQGDRQGRGQGPLRACRAEIKKFCEGVKPGQGRIIACLKSNSSGLSSECAEVVAHAPDRPARENGQGRAQQGRPAEEGQADDN